MNNLSKNAPEQMIGNTSKNFFYEKIKENFKSNDNNTIPDIGSYININIEKASKKEFEIICSISYLFGMDFCSQQYPKKEIWNNVLKRLIESNIDFNIFEKFIDFLFVENVANKFIDAKESMNNEINKELLFENPAEKIAFNQVRAYFKSVINNSFLPVNLVISIDETISKSDKYTYLDLLAINNYVVKDCLYVGAYAIKNYIKLYSNKLWLELIDTATKKFDNQKFALMYFDSFLSLTESIKRMKLSKEDLIEMFQNSFDYDMAKENWEIQISQNDTKNEDVIESSENEYKIPSNDKLTEMINNGENVAFIDSALLEVNKNYFKSDEAVISTIVSIAEDIENSDFMQNIYTFLANTKSHLNVNKLFDENNVMIYNFTYNLSNVELLLKEKLKEIQFDYKTKLEFICKDIPEEKLVKVTNLINTCIGDLYIENEEHKKYFISQMIESSVKTWFNFQQMMTLIETSKIAGKDMLSYVALNRYINNDEKLLEIFDTANKIAPLELKLRFILLFSEWFEQLNKEIDLQKNQSLEEPIKNKNINNND